MCVCVFFNYKLAILPSEGLLLRERRFCIYLELRGYTENHLISLDPDLCFLTWITLCHGAAVPGARGLWAGLLLHPLSCQVGGPQKHLIVQLQGPSKSQWFPRGHSCFPIEWLLCYIMFMLAHYFILCLLIVLFYVCPLYYLMLFWSSNFIF